MTTEYYEDKAFRPATLAIIEQANDIIQEYMAEGFSLTLRQLYYQFVSRDLLANTERNYKRLGNIISDGRLAGMIDREAIVDRGRYLRQNSHWDDPAHIIQSCLAGYRVDWWENQAVRLEVWIEKEALIGVIADVCKRWDVPYFACKGYVSQSEAWEAGRRIRWHFSAGQSTYVIHLGDHDPSGIDMTRDNHERLGMFSAGAPFHVKRIALNYDQVEQYRPPPNPAKFTDSRYKRYVRMHGNKSWELDALEPRVISRLIEEEIKGQLDPDLWEETRLREEADKAKLRELYELSGRME